jgi:SAM-dependent methyltransferase
MSDTKRIVNGLRWRLLSVIRRLFSAMGRSWNDFYAWMLDFQDRNVTLDQILSKPINNRKFKGLWDWWRGEQWLLFMQKHGLKPSHRVLDYGCGYGRVTIPLLKFQAAGGHYIGTEISQKRLNLADEWIQREALTEKSFELHLSRDNTMPFIETASVDVVWVLSVFNHMPDAELEETLRAIGRVLREGGILFCYYLVDGDSDERSVKTFLRSDSRMKEILARHGLYGEVAADWWDTVGETNQSIARMRVCRRYNLESKQHSHQNMS